MNDATPFTETVEVVIDGVFYNDIVPRNYRMCPLTEDLVFGSDLKNGMVVLGAHGLRDESQPELNNVDLPVVNRWCTVTNMQNDKQHQFIAEYSDGQKAGRFGGSGGTWIVKKDSIPKPTMIVVQPERFSLNISPSLAGCFAVGLLVVLVAFVSLVGQC